MKTNNKIQKTDHLPNSVKHRNKFQRKSRKYLFLLIALLNTGTLGAMVLALMAGQSTPSLHSLIPIFGLFYPIIFILNLLFLLFWIVFRSWFAIIPLIVFLFGIDNFSDNFQLSISGSQTKEDSTSLKVLTYNIQQFRNGMKVAQPGTQTDILSFIKKQNADIICLQEYQSVGNKLYENIKETRDDLHSGTYYYESYYNPKYNLLSGMVIFSKFQAVNSGKLKIHGSRTFGIYTDVIIGGDTVRVFNIHLASIKLEKEDLGFVANPDQDQLKNKSLAIYQKLSNAFLLREKQTRLMLDILDKTEYPILLCGDFNDTPSSWVYHQLQKRLNDSFVEEGSGISTTFAGPIPLLRIDYLLHSGFDTELYQRHQFKRSDHFPVSAILKLTH